MEETLILVGVDFSDAAEVAVERAGEVARLSGGRLIALHATDADTWHWSAERLDWLARVGLNRDQVVIHTGLPWLQLVRYAEQIRPAMVVVGSHGSGGFQPVTTGSTTSMLLTRARVPVLVVPPQRFPPRGEAAFSPSALRTNDEPWRRTATRTTP